MSNSGAPMPWWQIIAILAAVAVITGVCLGVLSSVAGLPAGWATIGVGAATGVFAAFLINKRRNADKETP